MSTITTIQASDLITNSRSDINTNFSNLNTDKMETSVLSTDNTLGGASTSDTVIASQKAVKTYIDTGGNPNGFTGIITPYGGSSAPSGWLLCNGSAVSRSTYSDLFAITGTTFGTGDGSTTFNVPNLLGRIPVGVGSGTKVATFASRASDVITVTGITNAANNEFQTGQAVTYHTSGSTITGLSNDTVYYLVRTGNLTFSLSSTLANAQKATVITLSSDGTGTQTFTLALTARTAGDTGGEEAHAMSTSELVPHTHTQEGFSAGGGAFALIGGSRATSQGSQTSSSTGANNAMNNMQPFIALNYIIKV